MRKTSLIVFSLLFSATMLAGEKEELTYLNELYGQKRYNEAIQQSKKFIRTYPVSEQKYSVDERLAKTYYVRRDYTNSLEAFNKILSSYALTAQQTYEFYYYIAKCYLQLEEPAKAIQTIKKIDKKSVFYERAFYDMGIIYLDRDDYENAFKTFKNIAVNGNVFKNPATFNMALTAYNDGKYQLVIDILNSYVTLKDKNRDDSAILYLYGTSYYKLNKTEEAIPYFTELTKRYSSTAYGKKAHIVLIEIYANKSNNEMVRKYSEAVKGTPEEAEAFVTLGDYYVSINEFSKAMSYYQRANLETTPRALYGYGYSLYRMDKIREALPLFIKLEKSSYYNQAVYYKFACYYKLKQYKTIVDNRKEAKKIVVTQQDNDNINIIIANSAYELNMYPLARDYYTKLNLHTPSKDNLFRVITMSGKLNKADDVEMRMNDYKRLYPGDKEYRKKIYVAAGESLYNNKKADLAEKYYREYLATENDPDILNALTALLVNEKKYSEMGQVLDKQADTTENRYLRAVSAAGLGNYEEAENYYQRVLSDIGNDRNNKWYPKVKSNQIKNYFLWGKYEKVISEGEAFVNLPNAIDKNDVIEKISISYYRLDNFSKSREYSTKLLSDPEKSDATTFQIADSYFAEKNYEKAKEMYNQIYTSSPDAKSQEIALYSLTKVATATKNIADFKKLSGQFLAQYPDSQYKENMLSNYSQVASTITNNADVSKTYKTIYDSSSEDHVKQNALEKMVEADISSRKYGEAERNAKLITNEMKRAYSLSQIYEKTKKADLGARQNEVLIKYADYKEYAAMNLAKYWYSKGSLAKARGYYSQVLTINGSSYKDVALFQMAQIDEKTGKKDSAISNYRKLYVEFPRSQYNDEAKLKAAQLTEAKSPNEALKIYMDIAKTSKVKSYKSFALEKLVYTGLKAKKMEIAKKYYNELKKVDPSAAKKYEQFFAGGAQ
ncbi:MAG: tetratricopeptide repeat protein [Fusobacteriaceae bacterium]